MIALLLPPADIGLLTGVGRSGAPPSARLDPMPELPEVDTIRSQLAPVLTGRQLVAGWSHPSAKFTDAVEAVGTTIDAVGRRGKYLINPLDDGRELIVHLGMTGSLRVTADPASDDDPYVRAWWDLDDGNRLVFRDVRRFGRIAVLEAGRYDGMPTLASLGPDPFDPVFDGDALWSGLRSSGRHLKTQLLSQRPVAGVGNIYADEALWAARLHPETPSADLSARAVTRLLAEVRTVLEKALAEGGTSFDAQYVNVNGQAGYFSQSLHVYGREGEQCHRCGAVIKRIPFGGRSSHFCPRCQRRH